MNLVIFLEGKDGSEKTTVAETIYKESPLLVDVVPNLSFFNKILRQKDNLLREWWFETSTYSEFADTLFSAFAKQIEYAQKMDKPIVIIDKGIITIRERVVATLICRGLTYNDAIQFCKSSEEKYCVKKLEGLHIFLACNREDTTSYSKQYQKYQDIYKSLDFADKTGIENVFVQNNGTVEETIKQIYEVVARYIGIVSNQKTDLEKVYGLTGLSESGKSELGKTINRHLGIWNLKLSYFVKNVCKNNHLTESEFYGESSYITGLLIASEIFDFIDKHYYVKRISVEGIHRYIYTKVFSLFFGEKYQTIYVHADYIKRLERESRKSMFRDNEKLVQIIRKKDITKIEHGLEEIILRGDNVCINNNVYKCEFENQIKERFRDICSYEGTLANVDDFKCPKNYHDVIKQYCKRVKAAFGKRLMGLVLTGSCYYGCVVEGFSDIDFLLIMDEVEERDIKLLGDMRDDYTIKVGYTVFTKKEVTRGHIDDKTKKNIWRLLDRRLKPLIWNRSLTFQRYSLEEIIEINRRAIPEFIHYVRRDVAERNTHGLVKHITVIMKAAILLEKGTDLEGYSCVFEAFAECFSFPFFDIVQLLSNINDKKIFSSFYQYCLNVVNFLFFTEKNACLHLGNIRKRAGVVLFSGDSVLLIHRKVAGEDYWVVPGGGIEKGEDSLTAAVREIKEELDLQLRPEMLKMMIIQDNNGQIEFYYSASIEYRMFSIGGEEAEKSSDKNIYIPSWITRNKLKNIDLRPAFIKDVICNDENLWK